MALRFLTAGESHGPGLTVIVEGMPAGVPLTRAWVERMRTAIRKHDRQHLITVGVIPWTLTWPNAKPLFYSETVGKNLDFVSVHFYPRQGAIDQALAALKKYDFGKPIVVEETFPLKCSAEELERFIAEASKETANGWISFYWGKTIEDYAGESGDKAMTAALVSAWLERFREMSKEKGAGSGF